MNTAPLAEASSLPVSMDNDSDSSKRKLKREREGLLEDDDEKSRNRGNYRCSKCLLPKKGHVCPYQQRIRRRDPNLLDGSGYQVCNVEIQCELDPTMTTRLLNLPLQGTIDSYLSVLLKTLDADNSVSSGNQSVNAERKESDS